MKGLRIAIALIILGFVLFLSVFTVQEWQKALLLRLGEVVTVHEQPGLRFKVPFIDSVRLFDARIQTSDARPEQYLTSEKKNLIVDSFVKWRIENVEKYYTALSGNITRANDRLFDIIQGKLLRAEFGKRTVQEVIADQRNEMMTLVTRKAAEQAKELGIAIIDVRIKRIDLPQEASESVYKRMRAERQRVAKELRSQGAESAERIRADADRQRTVLLADAYKASQTLRGEGDAIATDVYASAYSQDADFYAFYRSLSAYRTALSENSGAAFVLDTNNPFLRYFRSQPQ